MTCNVCIVSRMLPVAPGSYPGRWALDSKLSAAIRAVLFLFLHLKLILRRHSVYRLEPNWQGTGFSC